MATTYNIPAIVGQLAQEFGVLFVDEEVLRMCGRNRGSFCELPDGRFVVYDDSTEFSNFLTKVEETISKIS